MKIPLASLPPGRQRCFSFAGTSVLVLRTESGIFAVENVCPHSEFPLLGGSVADGIITCPVHGARFDLRTGEPLVNKRLDSLKLYSVSVEGDFAVLEDAREMSGNP